MARKPGRPPLDPHDVTVRVEVNLPGRLYDAVYAIARRTELSVPEVIRRQLARRRRTQNDDDQE